MKLAKYTTPKVYVTSAPVAGAWHRHRDAIPERSCLVGRFLREAGEVPNV